MPTQIELDAQQAADWIAQALSSSGYRTDFSPQSLWEIDRFFDEHSRNGKARPGGLLAENIGSRLFAIGSYVGEVLIRHLQGSWSGDDNDPQAEFNIEVVLLDESHVWPIQRVMKRLANGSEDSIAIYGSALGLSVGEHPKSYRPWWKFW